MVDEFPNRSEVGNLKGTVRLQFDFEVRFNPQQRTKAEIQISKHPNPNQPLFSQYRTSEGGGGGLSGRQGISSKRIYIYLLQVRTLFKPNQTLNHSTALRSSTVN